MSTPRSPPNNPPVRYAPIGAPAGRSRPLPVSPVPHSSVTYNSTPRTDAVPEANLLSIPVQPIAGMNHAGRGTFRVPSLGYSPSIRSLDTGPTAASSRSSLSLPYPRDMSERFNSDLDFETELLMTSSRYHEDDDDLHQPSASDVEKGHRGSAFTRRGLANVGFLFTLLTGLVFLFAGFPMVSYFRNQTVLNNLGAHGPGVGQSLIEHFDSSTRYSFRA
jgi:hypothetical protein